MIPGRDDVALAAQVHQDVERRQPAREGQYCNRITHINLGEVARIWRGGCIIRAQFLNPITEAYRANESLALLMAAPYFAKAVSGAQAAWRRVVIAATEAGAQVNVWVDGLDRLPNAPQNTDAPLLQNTAFWADHLDELQQRFYAQVVQGTASAFIEAKMAERDERHRRSGQSRYLVEPNIKDGKGGLRDLHTLFWIGKYFYRVKTSAELVGKGVLSAEEYRLFIRAEDFLWAIRCHLHYVTGRAEEKLTFDVQPDLAARLGYSERAGMLAVERFMKRYFLVAKDVGDLTRIFCASLEFDHGDIYRDLDEIKLAFQRMHTKFENLAPGKAHGVDTGDIRSLNNDS